MKISKTMKRIALLLAFCLVFTCFAGCGDKTAESSSSNPSSVTTDASSEDGISSGDITSEETPSEDASSNDASSNKPTENTTTSSSGKNPSTTTSSGKTSSTNPTSSAPQVVEKEPTSINDVIDFFVDVPAGREPVILQLTDTQTIDPTTETGKKYLGGSAATNYAPSNRTETIYKYIDETIKATKPDLILLTGDLTYGKYDDDGNCMKELIEKMESYKIPWAPVYGNHEAETLMGIDWYSKQLEDAKYCLFKQNQYYKGKVLTGNGNYTVGIRQGGAVTRVFFMLDSNGYDYYSQIKKKNNHSTGAVGVQADQMNWFVSQSDYIKKFSPKTQISVAFHIPIKMVSTVMDSRYNLSSLGKTGPFNLVLDTDPKRHEKDFGYTISKFAAASTWDAGNSAYNKFKAAGVDSIFVGHLHRMGYGVYHDNMYLVFGVKSSTHDSFASISSNGTIANGSISSTGSTRPLVGGTVMKITTSGTISDMYNYICE